MALILLYACFDGVLRNEKRSTIAILLNRPQLETVTMIPIATVLRLVSYCKNESDGLIGETTDIACHLLMFCYFKWAIANFDDP